MEKINDKELVIKLERMIVEAGAVRCIINNDTEITNNIKRLLEGSIANFDTWQARYREFSCTGDNDWVDNSKSFYGKFSNLMLGAMCSLHYLLHPETPNKEDSQCYLLLDSHEINELLVELKEIS